MDKNYIYMFWKDEGYMEEVIVIQSRMGKRISCISGIRLFFFLLELYVGAEKQASSQS